VKRSKNPDWLAFAVNELGGATKAAKKIGATRAEVASWLRDGVAKAPCGPIVRLVKHMSPHMTVHQFRLGPPKKG
jgi:hypothetical protein